MVNHHISLSMFRIRVGIRLLPYPPGQKWIKMFCVKLSAILTLHLRKEVYIHQKIGEYREEMLKLENLIESFSL